MSVILDDHDDQIQYSSGWVAGGTSLEYSTTTMTSNVAGSTATFTFEGTAITIYGSVSPGNASISFSIDQSPSRSYSTPAVNSPIFHQVFGSLLFLPTGSTPSVITQETTTEPHIIFLDYLIGGSEGLAPSTFEDTVHFSESPGTSMSFTFQGHSVSIHGPIVSGGDGTGFNASVVIDTGPAFMITQSNLSPSTITFNNKLFASSGLAPGNHTIVVTPLDAHPFYVDYFCSAPKPPIAAIAGGSVGGLALLLLLLFGALMQRSVYSAPGIAGTVITPFQSPPTTARNGQAEPPPPSYSIKYIPGVRC
ncbi:hypothetical protein B0H14DRAFT_3009171 [Mycena olivaceomarginata]|nr:hypothetical protein B0H14DRAFT_3009171 [Mycena olivaceomarginata]